MTEPAAPVAGTTSYYPTDAPPALLTPRAGERCPSCGEGIDGRYCAACGELRPSDRLYSLRAFAREAFETVTNVERSLLRTLVSLIRRPGELTAAYMRGERVHFLRPFQLFLLVSVLYFLWAGWSEVHVFNTRFSNHIANVPYRTIAMRIARERVPASGMTGREYAAAFDEKSLVLARSMIVVMVPMFAAAVALLSMRRRRSKPAVQHLVFSLHFFSVLLLLTIVSLYIVAVLVRAWVALGKPDPGWEAEDQLSLLIMVAGVLLFLVPALRRAYGNGWIAATVRGVALVGALGFIITAFRFLLFYTTTLMLS